MLVVVAEAHIVEMEAAVPLVQEAMVEVVLALHLEMVRQVLQTLVVVAAVAQLAQQLQLGPVVPGDQGL